MPKRSDVVAIALLYGIQVAAILALVLAANHQQLLTKEEANSMFVSPTFLGFRLQFHTYSTNFYAYVFFGAVGHFDPQLFEARFVKAVVMGLLTPVAYLYLRRRFDVPIATAFLGVAAIGFLPGILDFSWLGIEIGLETLLGLLALWLASFEAPPAVVASCVLAGIAAETYPPALIFIPVVLLQHAPKLKDARLRFSVITGIISMLAAMIFPLFWWTNAQTLILGGGRPAGSGIFRRAANLIVELFQHADSYYFFVNHAAAMGGMLIGLVCVAALLFLAARDFSRCWPLVAVAGGNLAMASIAGGEPGARRLLPLMLTLGMCGVAGLGWLARQGTWQRWASLALLFAAIAFELRVDNGFRQGLADSSIALPHDFEFSIPPGETMASTMNAFVTGARKLPDGMEGYEIDRTLAMVYRLTQPNPMVSSAQLVAACDRHGWSIPSTRPRLSRIFPRR